MSLAPAKNGELNPMVAVRSTGYSFDAIIGYQDGDGKNVAIVNEGYLQTLVGIANERFHINTERIGRFETALLEQYRPRTTKGVKSDSGEWEDAEARKRRKREEGLARQQALKTQENLCLENSMTL